MLTEVIPDARGRGDYPYIYKYILKYSMGVVGLRLLAETAYLGLAPANRRGSRISFSRSSHFARNNLNSQRYESHCHDRIHCWYTNRVACYSAFWRDLGDISNSSHTHDSPMRHNLLPDERGLPPNPNILLYREDFTMTLRYNLKRVECFNRIHFLVGKRRYVSHML